MRALDPARRPKQAPTVDTRRQKEDNAQQRNTPNKSTRGSLLWDLRWQQAFERVPRWWRERWRAGW